MTPRLSVVFDSNVYRGLSQASYTKLRQAEAECSVVGYANYFVAAELIAHLDRPESNSFTRALNALRRLWDHCRRSNGSQEDLEFVADSEAQVPHALFGKAPKNRAHEINLHGETIGAVVNLPVDQWPERTRLIVHAMADHVHRVEARFVADLWDIVVELNPAAASWADVQVNGALRTELLKIISEGKALDLIAYSFARKAADQTSVQTFDHELRRHARFIKKQFPLPVHLYNRLIHSLVVYGPDMTRKDRANSIWDLQVCFSVGRGARIRGVPIWLVTSDADVLEAARSAEFGWYVRSLEQYRAMFESGRDAFEAELSAEPVAA